MIHEFAVPAVIMALLFIGVLLRKLPMVRKTLIPAPIIGGLIGFILMNSGILPLNYAVFERITFHLFTLSFISITYMSTNAPKEKNKGVFRGGLWLALVFGLMISVQALVGSSMFLGYNVLTSTDDLIPALGGMIAHGFGQGPGQAVAMGTIWEGFAVSDAVQYGLLYATAGYLFAFIVGIPYAKRLMKKGYLKSNKELDHGEFEDLESGVIKNGKKEIFGYQTTHHSNVDTLSLHIALIGFTYLFAYIFAELITNYVLTGPQNEALIFGNMFVWGILFSFLIRRVLILTKFSYIVDSKVQGSITGTLVDYLMMSSLLAINISIIAKGLIPVMLNVLIVGTITFFIVLYLARRSGAYEYERFMTEFGIVTGTAATGLLLLRVVDPQFKTPVAKELIWWNILNLFVGVIVFLSQVALPVTNFWLWYGIVAVSIVAFLFFLKVLKLWGPRCQNV